jgi:hypothetical protein
MSEVEIGQLSTDINVCTRSKNTDWNAYTKKAERSMAVSKGVPFHFLTQSDKPQHDRRKGSNGSSRSF